MPLELSGKWKLLFSILLNTLKVLANKSLLLYYLHLRIAGWKQKEHPVLYNALHIGDQLLSIAGMTVNSSSEANKIIRNTNTLFVNINFPYPFCLLFCFFVVPKL